MLQSLPVNRQLGTRSIGNCNRWALTAKFQTERDRESAYVRHAFDMSAVFEMVFSQLIYHKLQHPEVESSSTGGRIERPQNI